MDRAEFIHLVRLSEHASADDSQAYRRKLALFAALGYLWVVGCFLLGIGVAWWALDHLAHNRFRASYIGLLVVAGGLLWASLRALWVRLPAPDGLEITQADAPVLFEALERIRKKIKGPPIHHVLLDDQFNASISQLPRYGLLGGAVNYLSVGLPLLMAIDRPRFLAVLAHEYGHLRGDHGQFAAWIYRTRLSWTLLEHHMRHDDGLVTMATRLFLRWYFPRFQARTFALARQDEFEADRIAGRLLGQPVAAAALTEMATKGAWLHTEFWPQHWRGAAASAQPVGPFVTMRQMLALPPDAGFASDALRQALRQISNIDDTHPVLRDRLEALDVPPTLPAWSARPALDVLASNAKWLAHFDKQWCGTHATDWKLHHAYLTRVRQRADALSASQARNNADEMTELGQLKQRLGLMSELRACFERALQLSPGHAGGLRGWVACLPEAEHAQRMDGLQQLYEHSAANRWWACSTAVRLLEPGLANADADGKLLKLW
ncbi:MAG: M48 family metalloprotease, partial [Rhodoferax sp.]